MKTLRTSKCSHHDHPEFQITIDSSIVVLDSDAEWFLRGLEEAVSQGERYSSGQTCQVGWMINEVRQHESGDLTWWEPDMRSFPVNWQEGINITLVQLRTQKDVVESVLTAEDITFPSLRQSAIICSRLEQSQNIIMERCESKELDSGWFFGCQLKDHDHNNIADLQRVSLYEAAVRFAPQIVPYLALPAGILVALKDGVPVIYRNGEPLTFQSGSFLATKYHIE